MASAIQLIALDLDGTLLDSHGRLPERNRTAVREACARGVTVILATGKSRASAAHLLRELDLRTPGVYTQGLTIFDGDGRLLHEITLDPAVTTAVVAYLEAHNLPTIAHAGTRLLTPADTPARRLLHTRFDEPLPEVVGPLGPQLDGLRINKLLVSDPGNNAATRAALRELVGARATVLQAVPEFIEVVPPHTSKGAGVTAVLGLLGIAPENVLAIGDGENDVEMLALAGIGVAMGNAHPRARQVADAVVANNDGCGVAEAIERFVLGR